jgi:hypothetical protein
MATEIRFAFALNGGVSLAIWIGGVADEVLRFVDAGKRIANGAPDDANPYTALCQELDVLPTVDVLAGTSAGGLNAACLGTAVIHGCTNLHPIKQLWLDHGSFDQLLRPPTDRSLVSLLNGDRNFLPYIETAFQQLAENGTGFVDVVPPVTVKLTATALGGRVTTINDGHGELSSVEHRAEFTFENADFDFANDDRAIQRLARACRSTASFPGAFEPSNVPVDLYTERHVADLFDGVTTPTVPLIDGAVLVNLPAQSTIEAIISQPSRERIERVMALVVPDPGEAIVAPGADAPPLRQVLAKSIVSIPRTQTLTEFMRELKEHNVEVRSRRAARDAMLAQFDGVDAEGAWDRFVRMAQTLFPAYRATRLAISLDKLASQLPHLGSGRRIDVDAFGPIDANRLPWIPDAMEAGGAEWCWGSAPVRRMAAVLITWINAVARAAPPSTSAALYAIKEEVSRVRGEAERISPTAGAFETMLAEELRDPGASPADAFERARRRWPTGDADTAAAAIVALNDQLARLAGCITLFVDRARSTIEVPTSDALDSTTLVALRGLLRLYDGAAQSVDLTGFLLSVEVLEATFAGNEPRPDQAIRLVQFTSQGAVTIDERQRSSPVDKLAGVELAHFGAFLKRSWRANDWMWGRLDASERLVSLLDAIFDQRLAKKGTLATHARAIQASILREELPTVVTEVEQDAAAGARVSDESTAFCDAVRAAAGQQGDMDLTGLDEGQLARLLAFELVGEENFEQEGGSELATMTSINALATTTAVARVQGPRFLRGPVGLLRAASLVAWRVARSQRSRQLRRFEGALAVVIGLVGLVLTALDLFTSVEVGAWRYAGWLCIVVALVLGVLAAPWLLVGAGRRLAGREDRAHRR